MEAIDSPYGLNGRFNHQEGEYKNILPIRAIGQALGPHVSVVLFLTPAKGNYASHPIATFRRTLLCAPYARFPHDPSCVIPLSAQFGITRQGVDTTERAPLEGMRRQAQKT